jgi:MFS transporter, DHA1 family, inner membrane transport protein
MLKNERVLLMVLAAIQFTNIVDFMIMMPMGDILQKALIISPAKYGILVSSYGLAAFVTAFLGVFYLDRLDRKKALLTAYAGFMVGTLSSALIPTTSNLELNYYLFICTRVVTGLTGGLLSGLVLSIVGDVIPLERRGRAMAMVTIAFSLASILGVPLSLMLVDAFGGNWHPPFYFVSIISLPVWVLAFRVIPSMEGHMGKLGKHRPFETIRLAFTTREQRNALLFTVLLVLGQFTVISFLTPYLIANVGLEQSDVKYIYLTGGACTVLSGMVIGRWVDKLGRFRVFTVFALLSILPVYINTHLTPVPLYVVLAIAGVFFIFISGRMIPANTIISSVVNPEHRAGFMSLNSAMMSLASGSSSIISGQIIIRASENGPLEHYDRVGFLAIGSTLLSLLVVRLLKGIAEEKSRTVVNQGQ